MGGNEAKTKKPIANQIIIVTVFIKVFAYKIYIKWHWNLKYVEINRCCWHFFGMTWVFAKRNSLILTNVLITWTRYLNEIGKIFEHPNDFNRRITNETLMGRTVSIVFVHWTKFRTIFAYFYLNATMITPKTQEIKFVDLKNSMRVCVSVSFVNT